jgi:hypothetical protein
VCVCVCMCVCVCVCVCVCAYVCAAVSRMLEACCILIVSKFWLHGGCLVTIPPNIKNARALLHYIATVHIPSIWKQIHAEIRAP